MHVLCSRFSRLRPWIGSSQNVSCHPRLLPTFPSSLEPCAGQDRAALVRPPARARLKVSLNLQHVSCLASLLPSPMEVDSDGIRPLQPPDGQVDCTEAPIAAYL